MATKTAETTCPAMRLDDGGPCRCDPPSTSPMRADLLPNVRTERDPHLDNVVWRCEPATRLHRRHVQHRRTDLDGAQWRQDMTGILATP
jgi:hypothetical protein